MIELFFLSRISHYFESILRLSRRLRANLRHLEPVQYHDDSRLQLSDRRTPTGHNDGNPENPETRLRRVTSTEGQKRPMTKMVTRSTNRLGTVPEMKTRLPKIARKSRNRVVAVSPWAETETRSILLLLRRTTVVITVRRTSTVLRTTCAI